MVQSPSEESSVSSPVIGSASPRDSPPASTLPPHTDALERDKSAAVPGQDVPYRLRACPRAIELFDWIIPFHMFTVLMDLRDRLRYAYSLPPELEPDLFPGKPRQETMSKARAEATVTKVMGPPPKPRTVKVNDPYNISARTLADYIASTTGNKVRIPDEVCRIVLGTDDRLLRINGRKVPRSTFEAILQCRYHEEEGAFVDGIVFETTKIKEAVERERNITGTSSSSAIPAAVPSTPASSSHSSSSSISTLDLAATTATSMTPSIATTPMISATPVPESPSAKSLSTLDISSPDVHAKEKSLVEEKEKAKGKKKEEDGEKEDDILNFQPELPPFCGYEPERLAAHASFYLSEYWKELVVVEESLVRILFGMPERGRTFKVGGLSGWGKYGKDVQI